MSAPTPHHAPPRTERAGLLGVVVRVLMAVVLGGAVGLIGTVAHRTQWADLPGGLVLALLLTVSAAMMCRAWSGLSTLLAAGAGWLVVVQLLATTGPGGDVLVPADLTGYVWTYGGLVLFAVAAFLPSRWFSDQVAPERGTDPAPHPARHHE
ncbi:DUF6113 family protein [Isoptericola jiangsuensis]|uniref:DUF6113 family protein n=1 Tax=Isoptericola jiangsuensis TaxID=548579 RepID=UPI003AAC61DA